MTTNRILVIGGTDTSGGAGLTRDTATAASLGVEVSPVVTAVTAQTHSGMTGVCPMSADFVREQLNAALASGSFGAVKIGMLGTCEVAERVARSLASHDIPTVIDPVLKTSSGSDLMSRRLPQRLLAQADLLTPNLPEAAELTGRAIATTDREIARQASEILRLGARAVLIKGGHGSGATSVDHLFDASGHRSFIAPRLPSGRRGTGCALATAIACFTTLGRDRTAACRLAKSFVHDWIGAVSRATGE